MQNSFELIIPLGCKLSTLLSNANFRYYGSPIISNGAVLNQPICIDLELCYFRSLQ